MTDVILRMENIVKTFPGTVANKDINLEVLEGEIHCLLGENGAGKTVLMSTLYGLYQPDSGKIYYKGKEVEIHSPKDAIQLRIGMVHQHFMLIDTLTVTENIILGQDKGWKVLNDMGDRSEKIRKLSDDFGLQINPDALVSSLSVGEEQRVEILKALYHGVDLLILDEPTAVLTPQETVHLLSFLRDLADKGMTIIFITHKLEEVIQISDRVTILRDAQKVKTINTADTNSRELATLMVGRDVLMELPERQGERGEVALSIKKLSVRNERGLTAVHDVSFDVHKREVVGIAGVSGNGQTELALALTGLVPIESGNVYLKGEEIKDFSPKKLGKSGFAHVPEDRHKMAIVMPLDVSENTILHEYNNDQFSLRGFLKFEAIKDYSLQLVEQYDVRLSSIDIPISNLSGGNQQKVVVARELNRNPQFLIANQPTRGIDIGATEFVRQQILHARDAGSAVLLISTELEEIFHLSDRILVMYEGKIVGELPPDRALTEEIGLLMAGKKEP